MRISSTRASGIRQADSCHKTSCHQAVHHHQISWKKRGIVWESCLAEIMTFRCPCYNSHRASTSIGCWVTRLIPIIIILTSHRIKQKTPIIMTKSMKTMISGLLTLNNLMKKISNNRMSRCMRIMPHCSHLIFWMKI